MPHGTMHWPLFRLPLTKANIEIKPISNFSSSLSIKLLAPAKVSVFEKYWRGAVAKFLLTFSGFCGVKSIIVINIIMILPFAFMQAFSCWLFLCFISFVLLNFSPFCSSTVSTIDVLEATSFTLFFILHTCACVRRLSSSCIKQLSSLLTFLTFYGIHLVRILSSQLTHWVSNRNTKVLNDTYMHTCI